MVKTELEYNPYLQETKVKFNGKEPRINSLIEKYKEWILQDWMKEIPKVFYEEMNGYDFELEFTGTIKEFEDLKKTFTQSGIDENLVRFVHKNELDGRDVKVQRIQEILEWMESKRNHRFDYESFIKKNGTLKDGVYTFIIIQGRNVDTSSFKEKNMSFEYIEDVTKLDDTELSNTPILLCIDKDSLSELQSNIGYIINRKDIQYRQLFFCIDGKLNEKEIVRIITDMGIESPQLVSSLNDEKIMSYISIYPITDYIYSFIKMARKEFERIRSEAENDKIAREETNKVIYEQIDEIESLLERMNEVCNRIKNKDNLAISENWLCAKEHVFHEIDKWKAKKTKTIKKTDAIEYSTELNEIVQTLFREFVNALSNYYVIDCGSICQLFEDWYEEIEYDVDYKPDIVANTQINISNVENIQESLLKIKEEEYVIPKDDFFENIGKFFGNSNQETEKEPVLEVSYYYQKWREYAKEMLLPIIDSVIKDYFESLQKYYLDLANAYLEKIGNDIKEQEERKETISLQLSDEDKQLEEDLTWCAKAFEQLKVIERG